MDCVVTPLKTLMGFSVHLNVQLKFYNLPNGEKVTVPFGSGLVDVDRYIDFINKLKPYTYATFEATKEDKLDGALHALHHAETKSNKIIIQ